MIINTAKFVAIALLIAMLTACKKDLYSGLSERDANEMISVLVKNGIDASRVPDKNDMLKIRVAESNFAQAVDVLKQYGYPREQFASMGEVFKKEGLISSPLEEKARYIYALSQHISETLTQIDGVITARVNLVLPKDDSFADEINPASASVFIKYDPKTNLLKNKSNIKLIVEKSIEGISYDKITVVMLPAETKSAHNIVQAMPVGGFQQSARIGLIGVIVVLLIFIGWVVFGARPAERFLGLFAKDKVKG